MELLARPCRAVVREASSSRSPALPAPIATGVNHQLPGQDSHLLDIDTLHGAPGLVPSTMQCVALDMHEHMRVALSIDRRGR